MANFLSFDVFILALRKGSVITGGDLQRQFKIN